MDFSQEKCCVKDCGKNTAYTSDWSMFYCTEHTAFAQELELENSFKNSIIFRQGELKQAIIAKKRAEDELENAVLEYENYKTKKNSKQYIHRGTIK